MKCDEKYLEAYLNNELSETEAKLLQEHIAVCGTCGRYIMESQKLSRVLQGYRHEDMDNHLLYSLKQIQYETKKKFCLFNLFPRELAFSAMTILVALYLGAFVSIKAINTNHDFFAQDQDYLEQISLASWMNY